MPDKPIRETPPDLADEIRKIPFEPLAAAEKKLLAGSLLLGILLLGFLMWLTQAYFTTGGP